MNIGDARRSGFKGADICQKLVSDIYFVCNISYLDEGITCSQQQVSAQYQAP
jgi:hypothetical protein